MQFSAIKETARQISELSHEDYIALDGCYTPTQSPDFSLDIYEPIATQLSALIDQLKAEKQGGGAWTSDSGALSDYESSVCETEGLNSSGSNSLITLCGEEKELSKELEELGVQSGESDADVSTTEKGKKDSVTDTDTVTSSSPCTEVSANGITPHDGQSNKSATARHKLSSDRRSVKTPHSVRKTSEDKDREIGDLLSKIKSMSPEELPSCSKLETHKLSPEEVHPSNNSDVILVSDLEKELFSDSSEDVSPEKPSREQHKEGPEKFRVQRTPQYEQSKMERGASKWQRDSEPAYSTYGSRYNNRRGYRQKYRGRGFRSYPGRDRYRKEDDAVENRSYTPQNAEEGGEPEVRASRKSEDKTYRETVTDENNNCNKEGSDYSIRKDRQGGRGGQLSPLVHSQNMWSSPRRGSYRQRRYIASSQDTFNHYEVGCFLMEGMLHTPP